jgi:hypothetical protein
MKAKVRPRDVIVMLAFVLMAPALALVSYARLRTGQVPPNKAPISNR